MLDIGDGQFKFLTRNGLHFPEQKKTLQITWQAITDTNHWEYIANHFGFRSDIQDSQQLQEILLKMLELGYDKSDLSMFCDCLRYMWRLVTYGEELFQFSIYHKMKIVYPYKESESELELVLDSEPYTQKLRSRSNKANKAKAK